MRLRYLKLISELIGAGFLAVGLWSAFDLGYDMGYKRRDEEGKGIVEVRLIQQTTQTSQPSTRPAILSNLEKIESEGSGK